jgi:diaminopimelate epimerase
MHGTGNQVLIADERALNRPPPSAERIRELAAAADVPGFDQLMWVTPADDDSSAAGYRVFNADGSEVEQCGNGARCVARLVAREAGGAGRYRLASPAGIVEARVDADGRVAVNMGTPEFRPPNVPFVADGCEMFYDLDVDGQSHRVSVVSMGNPHCVLLVDDVATAPVATLGPAIERHPRFPDRANVGFMAIRSRSAIDLRVWERGVGETRACGTGACAAVAVARRLGKVGNDVDVHLPGGAVVVSWRASVSPVWLAGDAEFLSEGTIDL